MLEKEVLAEFSIFSDVPEEVLSEIAQMCSIKEFQSDEVIFKEGDKAENLYGVLDGEVELSLVFRDKVLKTNIEYEESIQSRFEIMEKPIVVDTLGPGEVLGWSALVRPQAMTATAKCSQTTRMFSISAGELKARYEQDPKLGFAIMERLAEIISRRLQTRTDKLIESWGEAFDVDTI